MRLCPTIVLLFIITHDSVNCSRKKGYNSLRPARPSGHYHRRPLLHSQAVGKKDDSSVHLGEDFIHLGQDILSLGSGHNPSHIAEDVAQISKDLIQIEKTNGSLSHLREDLVHLGKDLFFWGKGHHPGHIFDDVRHITEDINQIRHAAENITEVISTSEKDQEEVLEGHLAEDLVNLGRDLFFIGSGHHPGHAIEDLREIRHDVLQIREFIAGGMHKSDTRPSPDETRDSYLPKSQNDLNTSGASNSPTDLATPSPSTANSAESLPELQDNQETNVNPQLNKGEIDTRTAEPSNDPQVILSDTNAKPTADFDALKQPNLDATNVEEENRELFTSGDSDQNHTAIEPEGEKLEEGNGIDIADDLPRQPLISNVNSDSTPTSGSHEGLFETGGSDLMLTGSPILDLDDSSQTDPSPQKLNQSEPDTPSDIGDVTFPSAINAAQGENIDDALQNNPLEDYSLTTSIDESSPISDQQGSEIFQPLPPLPEDIPNESTYQLLPPFDSVAEQPNTGSSEASPVISEQQTEESVPDMDFKNQLSKDASEKPVIESIGSRQVFADPKMPSPEEISAQSDLRTASDEPSMVSNIPLSGELPELSDTSSIASEQPSEGSNIPSPQEIPQQTDKGSIDSLLPHKDSTIFSPADAQGQADVGSFNSEQTSLDLADVSPNKVTEQPSMDSNIPALKEGPQLSDTDSITSQQSSIESSVPLPDSTMDDNAPQQPSGSNIASQEDVPEQSNLGSRASQQPEIGSVDGEPKEIPGQSFMDLKMPPLEDVPQESDVAQQPEMGSLEAEKPSIDSIISQSSLGSNIPSQQDVPEQPGFGSSASQNPEIGSLDAEKPSIDSQIPSLTDAPEQSDSIASPSIDSNIPSQEDVPGQPYFGSSASQPPEIGSFDAEQPSIDSQIPSPTDAPEQSDSIASPSIDSNIPSQEDIPMQSDVGSIVSQQPEMSLNISPQEDGPQQSDVSSDVAKQPEIGSLDAQPEEVAEQLNLDSISSQQPSIDSNLYSPQEVHGQPDISDVSSQQPSVESNIPLQPEKDSTDNQQSSVGSRDALPEQDPQQSELSQISPKAIEPIDEEPNSSQIPKTDSQPFSSIIEDGSSSKNDEIKSTETQNALPNLEYYENLEQPPSENTSSVTDDFIPSETDQPASQLETFLDDAEFGNLLDDAISRFAQTDLNLDLKLSTARQRILEDQVNQAVEQLNLLQSNFTDLLGMAARTKLPFYLPTINRLGALWQTVVTSVDRAVMFAKLPKGILSSAESLSSAELTRIALNQKIAIFQLGRAFGQLETEADKIGIFYPHIASETVADKLPKYGLRHYSVLPTPPVEKHASIDILDRSFSRLEVESLSKLEDHLKLILE